MLPQTEMLRNGAEGLDLRPDLDVLTQLHASQMAALECVQSCLPQIAEGAGILAQTIRDKGRIHYAAAGSSGLMALADGAELPGTYGISPNVIAIWMAGGVPTGADMPGHTEDDERAAQLAAQEVVPGDAVVALSASGTTPYPVAFVHHAREAGAKVICIANNANAPLFDRADCAILLNTPPEMIAGSTRMGAATAQKAALNMLSTLMGIRLGHVHDGMMVNVVADNQKLRQRAEGIIQKIADVSAPAAQTALELASGNLKQAILLAAGANTAEQAQRLLTETGGHLRPALNQL